MKIEERIEQTKREMQGTKKRSRRRIELELRLRDLRTEQLRLENPIVQAKGASVSVRYSISTWLGGWFARSILRIHPGKPQTFSTGAQ